MTVYKWIDSVRKGDELTVFDGISSGQWANVFTAALASFNKNSGLKIKMVPSENEDDANIVILLSSGTSTYGDNPKPIVINPEFGHGKTRMFRDEASGEISKVVAFLPITPKENHINVLRMITVHELIHACGLDDNEHSNDGVFMTLPNIRNGQIFASATSKKMPPLFFSQKTKGQLRQNFA